MNKLKTICFFMLVSCIGARSEAALTQEDEGAIRDYIYKFPALQNSLLELANEVSGLLSKGPSSKGIDKKVENILEQKMQGFDGQIDQLKTQIAKHVDDTIATQIASATKNTFNPIILEKTKELDKKNKEIEQKHAQINETFKAMNSKLEAINALKHNQEELIKKLENNVYDRIENKGLFSRLDTLEGLHNKINNDFSKNSAKNQKLYQELSTVMEALKKDTSDRKNEKEALRAELKGLKNSIEAQSRNAIGFRTELNDIMNNLNELARSKVEENALEQPVKEEKPKKGFLSFLGL